VKYLLDFRKLGMELKILEQLGRELFLEEETEVEAKLPEETSEENRRKHALLLIGSLSCESVNNEDVTGMN
jgi:hypothetical protein